MKETTNKERGIEEDVLKDLLEKQHADSFGWAMACCSYNRDAAEEVLQTVYLKILEGRAKFNGYSSFRTWLFSVIRNTAFDLQRKKRLRINKLAALFDYSDHEYGPDFQDPLQYTEFEQEKNRLETALLKLPGRQQEILHLVFYQGLTVEQAGEALKISSGSARTHYERGKARLRRLLAETEENIPMIEGN